MEHMDKIRKMKSILFWITWKILCHLKISNLVNWKLRNIPQKTPFCLVNPIGFRMKWPLRRSESRKNASSMTLVNDLNLFNDVVFFFLISHPIVRYIPINLIYGFSSRWIPTFMREPQLLFLMVSRFLEPLDGKKNQVTCCLDSPLVLEK